MQFIFRKRIYGYECDIYGHLNNANYLLLLEAARSEALQEMDMPIQKLLDMHWHIYVLRFELDYIKAIQLEDIIEVRSRIISMTKVKGNWIQEIFNSKGELCFQARLTAVFAHNGKPARLTPEIYDLFARYQCN
ncbi:MAG: acyl-CoA thioesterase [Candidatus Cloacimonetes bacterium]|nr:acyl-CoA thioesterase [Candidatus Cloacimonadota bacterium]